MASKDHDALKELNTRTYANQAKWFINTMWPEKFSKDEKAREEVRAFVVGRGELVR
jgi:hypothetical protein